MRIEFDVSQETDSKLIWFMLQGDDWPDRAKLMGLDVNFAKRIHSSPESEHIREINELVNRTYQNVLPQIERSVESYQSDWDKIIDEFSDTVAELTYPWFYEEYFCVVTHYHRGVSSDNNFIARWWKDSPQEQRRITAHEVLLAHYLAIHRNHFQNSGLDDNQIWALAEIAAFALTGFEPRLTKFWPWDDRGYYTNHNYPQIVELQQKLREPFLNRRSFEEYIEKGIALIRETDISK